MEPATRRGDGAESHRKCQYAGYRAVLLEVRICLSTNLYNAEPYEDPSMARVTVINDDPAFLELMDDVLEQLGHEAFVLSAEAASLDTVVGTRPDVLVLDLHLKGDASTGWTFAIAARAHPALVGVPVIIASGDHRFLREREEELGAMTNLHVLPKPFTLDEVEGLLGRTTA